MIWILKMAWRDWRRHKQTLLLCMLSIVFGVAALVAINVFGDNLKTTIDRESKNLLGADLQIHGSSAFSSRAESFFKKIGGEQARETRFTSMAYFAQQDESRFVLVKAWEGNFPFYGDLVTEPQGISLTSSDEPVAWVDESLSIQFNLKIGDPLKLGDLTFKIAGSVKKVPGEAAFSGVLAPPVYISKKYLKGTGLLQYGSVARYRIYFKLNEPADGLMQLNSTAQLLADEQLRYETVETRKKRLGKTLDNVYRFLRLVSFVALLLGAISIVGSIQVYLNQKRASIAVLRCLGVQQKNAFAIYWVQVMVLGFVGVVIGAVLGIGFSFYFPQAVSAFLPFELNAFISWQSVSVSVFAGWIITFLFSLFPLIALRHITPLKAIRSGVEDLLPPTRDLLFWVILFFVILLLLVYCMVQAAVWWQGLVFAAGFGVSLLIFYGLALLVRFLLRKLSGAGLPFVWRQGMGNLYRPNNRTVFLVMTLGMGAFLIYTVFLVEHMLLNQTNLVDQEEEPNILFYDVQSDQRAGLHALIGQSQLEVIDEAPVVTMRLAKIADRSVASLRSDPDNKIQEWILNREWRATYRDHLKEDTETMIEGTFIGDWDSSEEPIPISVEQGMAEDLAVVIGDRIHFDVQGIPIETVVSSIRKVDWQRMRSNFFTVFPKNVLEEAPTFFITFTQSPNREATVALQKKVVQKFPNINVVDLRLILDSLKSVLNRVSYVLNFMGSFTLLTGLAVLMTAVLTSRYQRVSESVLLRTLGASSFQIKQILSIEYFFLGMISGVVAALLSLVSTWALGTFIFKTALLLPWAFLPVAVATVSLLTVVVGLLNSRGISTHPPLAILREE